LFRQTRNTLPKLDHKRNTNMRPKGHLYDTDTTYFQHPADGLWRGGNTISQINPVVGNKIKTRVNQSKQKIGFTNSWRPQKKYTLLSPRSAASMDLMR